MWIMWIKHFTERWNMNWENWNWNGVKILFLPPYYLKTNRRNNGNNNLKITLLYIRKYKRLINGLKWYKKVLFKSIEKHKIKIIGKTE